MSSVPDILILTSLSPKEQAGMLYSPNLAAKAQEYSRHEGQMWSAFLETESGELLEEHEARRLADYYHLKTALKLQSNPRDPLLWTERFNQAGQEIYGDINPAEVQSIAAQELRLLGGVDAVGSMAVEAYQRLAGGGGEVTASKEAQVDFGEFRQALFGEFAVVVDTIEALEEGQFEAPAVRACFQTIIDKLAEEEPEWLNWTITNPDGKTMLAVVALNKEIEIPDGRGPVGSKQELLGLALHELGVHATRAVNGQKTGDSMMEKNGLPNYIDFEEGLGVFFEYMTTGKIPEKARDRYIDIALATGLLGGYRLSREELIELGISRQQARAMAAGQDIVAVADEKAVITHVNRIFRGGNGLPIRDDNGDIIDQAVFNKDQVYYQGFVKAQGFIQGQLQAGFSPKRVIDFLLAGKFDATNPRHVAYVAEKHQLALTT